MDPQYYLEANALTAEACQRIAQRGVPRFDAGADAKLALLRMQEEELDAMKEERPLADEAYRQAMEILLSQYKHHAAAPALTEPQEDQLAWARADQRAARVRRAARVARKEERARSKREKKQRKDRAARVERRRSLPVDPPSSDSDDSLYDL